MNLEESINQFLKGHGKSLGRKPDERYTSFDYCYNYFYSFYENEKIDELSSEENLQMSCLQLGFYLASWGMMRGSSFLLQKSVRNFSKVIQLLSKTNPILWEIDVDKYDELNIERLLSCKNRIGKSLGIENNASDTLVTKIMLGIFANIPAFDQFFKKSMKVWSVNKRSLLKIKEYYRRNNEAFDSTIIYTIDFLTSKETHVRYTKAKLIDMVGFIEGQN